MRIIVSIKQVPTRDSTPRVSPNGRVVDDSELAYEMNGPDAYALEAALQLRDKHGSEVVVLCAGPQRAGKIIREALAKGAHRGIHVLTSDQAVLPPLSLAKTLAAAAESEMPDLFLTGLQSEDDCYGQTSVLAAELLGYAHATIVTEVEPGQGEVRVRKELEDGWSQYLTLPMPAVLSIQSGQTTPRLATMLGIRQAKDKPVKVVPLSSLYVHASDDQIIHRLFIPSKHTDAQVFTGEARDCARRLVAQLRSEALL